MLIDCSTQPNFQRTAICKGPPFAKVRHLQAAGDCIFSSSRYGSYLNGPYVTATNIIMNISIPLLSYVHLLQGFMYSVQCGPAFIVKYL